MFLKSPVRQTAQRKWPSGFPPGHITCSGLTKRDPELLRLIASAHEA
jgi:hypothetical protein